MAKQENKNPVRKENYNFQYVFTEAELKEKSKQLAKACDDRNALEDEKKSIMSDFKAKIDSKSAEINILSNHINTGHEWLNKTCSVEFDFDKGTKKYYYEGLHVGTEKMRSQDYQLQAEISE